MSVSTENLLLVDELNESFVCGESESIHAREMKTVWRMECAESVG